MLIVVRIRKNKYVWLIFDLCFSRNFIPSLLRLQSSKSDEPQPDKQKTQSIPEKQHCDKLDVDGNSVESNDLDKELTDDKKPNSNINSDEDDGEENDSNATKLCDGNLVDSTLSPVDRKQQRIAELQKMKANCKSENLEKLKTKCEILVRDCIAGLLVQLSDSDFRSMEGK